MGRRTFERKAPFATTSFKKRGVGVFLRVGIFLGDYGNSSRHDYETIMLLSVSTLCFFSFFRLGELLSPTNTKYDSSSDLSFEDVAVDSHSSQLLLKIHLKTSKIDQEQMYTWGKLETFCAMCPPCQPIWLSGVLYLAPSSSYRIEHPWQKTTSYRSLTNIGLKASQYAGHRFRIGATTTAAEKGIEDSLIKAMGRLKSQAYLTYIKTAPDTLAKVSSSST